MPTALKAEFDVPTLLKALRAWREGDFDTRLPGDWTGVRGEVAETFNTIVAMQARFARDLARVANDAGKQGRLSSRMVAGLQPDGGGPVTGAWVENVAAINALITDLGQPTTEVTRVMAAVSSGDLLQRMAVEMEARPLKGEFLRAAKTVNAAVEMLGGVAGELTRVAREVGYEGKLGGQAQLKDMTGTWKDLADAVNLMASNLTEQVRNIAEVTTAVAKGDLSRKITVDVRGEILLLKNTVNTMVDQLSLFASEVTRLAREVGFEGKLGGQAQVKGVGGTWKDLTDTVNSLVDNLTSQVRNIAEVTTAVANGDLSRKITVDVRGEVLELKTMINTMVDQLNAFSFEVSRVAREVGTEGKLGGQAQVAGTAGTWKELTDNVNFMVANLTSQVRNIAEVTTAVANGDLSRKITVGVRGEVLELKSTVNTMVDQLNAFSSEVSRVAREVGTEGTLGGQASVPGAAGAWRALTDNVNQLAGNLTTQVRAIAEVSTAVTMGDFSRTITVEAKGEVDALKANLNAMIRNLRDSTVRSGEQDWLKTNIAKFTRMLQGERDVMVLAGRLLSELAPVLRAQHAVFFLGTGQGDAMEYRLIASYAYKERKSVSSAFRQGEGLVGQAVIERERILVTEVPADYVRIASGLGAATPSNLLVLPIVFEGKVLAVVEFASFNRFLDISLAFLDQFAEILGIVINSLAANARTDDALRQSQAFAVELQAGQAELRSSNERLSIQTNELRESEEKLRQQQVGMEQSNDALAQQTRLLTERNADVERKSRELQSAWRGLEEKAQQLTVTSRYKSDFLANMSHELRTPLNSLLILAKLLEDNLEGNLTDKQVEYAHTIHGAGGDLLTLINEVLDLSKIEAGKMQLEVASLALAELADWSEVTFRPVARQRGLEFTLAFAPDLPLTLATDGARLRQVLKNLLSNAFKFTERGGVRLRVEVATTGWNAAVRTLATARRVLAFSVVDTGIGIAPDKLQIIFEAFQQADLSTSRRFGGTGLGLAISREITDKLGGDLQVLSAPGRGSTFTVYLPDNGEGAAPARRVQPPIARPPARLPTDGPLMEATAIDDDRAALLPGDRVLLVLEDDPVFAGILRDLGRAQGFKVVVASRAADALAFARRHPLDAITLDIHLPDANGWAVLDQLKHDPATRHVPVHVITVDPEPARVRALGARHLSVKPVTAASLGQSIGELRAWADRPVRRLLVVSPDEAEQRAVVEIVGSEDVEIVPARTGKAALAALRKGGIGCVVASPILSDMSAFDLSKRMAADPSTAEVPVLVYPAPARTATGEPLPAEVGWVRRVPSAERLLDETTLFLHRVEADLSPERRRILRRLHEREPLLTGRTVLVVDDDVRNVYALTALLERHGVVLVHAGDGREALAQLARHPEVELILMDMMLPGMDGYAATKCIREMPEHARLPILAVTAKAMKGDRDQCLASGANDYISKPVDEAQLLSLLRVWLYA